MWTSGVTRFGGLGDQLEAFSRTVDFEAFRPDLEKVLAYSDGSKVGRPPFDPVLMVKILVIQTLNNLSDERAEYLINDRLSFMPFLGLALSDRVPGARSRLDKILERHSERSNSWLSWLRNLPQSPASRNVLRLRERLDHVRALKLDASRAASILRRMAFDRLSDEAARITPQHLAELPASRRHAILVAGGIRLEEILTDAALTMMDKLLGSMMCRAENRKRDKAIVTVRSLQGTTAPAHGLMPSPDRGAHPRH